MIKKILLTVISLVVLSNATNFSVGGYVENSNTVLLNSKATLSDNSLLKVEGQTTFGKIGGAEAYMYISGGITSLDPFENFRDSSVLSNIAQNLMSEYIIQGQSIFSNILPPEIFDVGQSQTLYYLPYSSIASRSTITLDRAVIKLFLKSFDLYIGRQTIAWGTGYGFNPTDIWNNKNPLDPTAPKSGVNALRAEIPLGSVSGISLVLHPGIDIDHSSGGIRIKWNVGNYDMSVCGMKVMNSDRVLYSLPKKIMLGTDLAGNIKDVGIWYEIAASNPIYADMKYTDLDSVFVQADIGLNYTFENGIMFMLEYYFNGLGETNRENYNKAGFMKLVSGEMIGLGKNYLMGGLTKNMFEERLATSLFAIVNVDDNSAMLLPSLEWRFTDNLTLKISGNFGVGNKKYTEYGSVYSFLGFKMNGYF